MNRSDEEPLKYREYFSSFYHICKIGMFQCLHVECAAEPQRCEHRVELIPTRSAVLLAVEH